MSINLTFNAIAEHEIDTVVIDTAPSRNAMDFITYPKRLARLLGGRAIGWMTGLGQRTAGRSRMGRVDRLLVWAIGPVVTDVAEFFAELARVRERFVWLNERVGRLLARKDDFESGRLGEDEFISWASDQLQFKAGNPGLLLRLRSTRGARGRRGLRRHHDRGVGSVSDRQLTQGDHRG